MYPTSTTSTTGTFRVPPAPPQAAAVRATGDLCAPALPPRPEAALPTCGDLPVSTLPSGPGSGSEPEPERAAVAAAVVPAPVEAPAETRAVTARTVRPGSEADASGGEPGPAPRPAQDGLESGVAARALGAVVGGDPESDVPVRALGSVVGGPAAALPGGDGGDPVPAGTVALPHGRPAVESAWNEVPAARIRVEPEPVHALAGASGERTEPCGSPYGHEPEPLGSVPAPAASPHASAGVPTLRLRVEPAPPAGSETRPQAGAGPREPYVRAGLPAGFRAHSGADGSADRHGDAAPPEPYIPQSQLQSQPQSQPQPVQGGFRDRPGQVWPLAVPGADGPAHRYGEPWPPAAPEDAPEPRPPHAPPAPPTPYVPQPHDGAEAESEHRPGGVPGPAAEDLVARAPEPRTEEGGAQDPPRSAPGRGAAATEVPVHLPFPAESRPTGAPATGAGRHPAPASAPAVRPSTAPAQGLAEPGRRVPRGDERLREHRGPVLPGWVAVGTGALALTGCLAVLWRAGAVPAPFVAAFGAEPRAYEGLRATHWPPLAFLGIVALLALGGLGRAKAGHAWVLTLFGRYRGTVRRTGLTWVSPLLLRRRVDVRLRHWRSEPMPAVDSGGLALRVVVQVVWQVKDTARATLAVEDHTDYLAEQVESAMARVLSQLPADAFHEDAPTLRDSEAVGDALTRMLAAETEAVGIEVYSAQPTRIEYAPEVAEAMRRRRVAAIDAKHRDTVLTSVVDAVDDTVHRLTSRGLVELDDYERKALVKDLTVAFYTGRPE
ncbi:SPFH domain-containing protein [Streptomyces roseus]|uniref:SPFH domain-containing protein n=1 Tax=Streptomyces roseus TaxID=66430 RepID=UPI0036C2B62E